MAKMLRQIDDEALERPFDKSQFFRLLKYMAPYKKTVIGSLCLMVVATLCSLGSPFLMSRAIGALQDKALDAETRLQYANAAARLSAPKGGKSAANDRYFFAVKTDLRFVKAFRLRANKIINILFCK